MQTFLASPDFTKSAQCLDYRRLGKQRVEAWQILQTLRRGSRWKNHPAVKMWRGHESCLADYGRACCKEWKGRGYVDNMLPRFDEFGSGGPAPYWLGLEEFHSKHRATLLSKNFAWYSRFGWTEEPRYLYWWPDPPVANNYDR